MSTYQPLVLAQCSPNLDPWHALALVHLVSRERVAELFRGDPARAARAVASHDLMAAWVRQIRAEGAQPPAGPPVVTVVDAGEGDAAPTPQTGAQPREHWLTVAEAARRARISGSAVRAQLIGNGPIRGVQPNGEGTAWRVDPDSVAAYLAQEGTVDRLRDNAAAGRLQECNQPIAA